LKGYHTKKINGKHGNSDWEFGKRLNILFPKPIDSTEESKFLSMLCH